MISIRSDLKIQEKDQVLYFLNEKDITKSDQKEFSANNAYEERIIEKANEKTIFEDLISKSSFIKTFKEFLPALQISKNQTVLEMGAAHGWASVLLKNEYPDSYVVASDLVPETVQHSEWYETLLNTQINEKWAFNCRNIPFQDETFDRIFTFAAFHHFGDNGDYTKPLVEMIRILKPNGKIVLLYEPSAPQYLYKFAYRRVNRRRHIDGVDEDVLILSKLKAITQKLGCEFSFDLNPFYMHRDGIGSTFYYYFLSRFSKIPSFQKMFINTANITISK